MKTVQNISEIINYNAEIKKSIKKAGFEPALIINDLNHVYGFY